MALKFTNPDFVLTYKTNRKILDPSKTWSTLKGVVTSSADNSFIKRASILIVETSVKATSNRIGEYEIKPVPSGKYSIKVTGIKFKESIIIKFSINKVKLINLT